MKPHEQRVIDERDELMEKMRKLNSFFSSDVFGGLPETDRILLQIQHDNMEAYLKTLNRRIARFPQ